MPFEEIESMQTFRPRRPVAGLARWIDRFGILGLRGYFGDVDFPLPTVYDAGRAFQPSTGDLVQGTASIVSLDKVSNTEQAKAYAYGGWRDSKRNNWMEAAGQYRFVWDLNEWTRKQSPTSEDRATILPTLISLLDRANKKAHEQKLASGGGTRMATKPTPAPTPPGPVLPPGPAPGPAPGPVVIKAGFFSPTVLIVGGLALAAVAVVPGLIARMRKPKPAPTTAAA